jgi:hypothetical protein
MTGSVWCSFPLGYPARRVAVRVMCAFFATSQTSQARSLVCVAWSLGSLEGTTCVKREPGVVCVHTPLPFKVSNTRHNSLGEELLRKAWAIGRLVHSVSSAFLLSEAVQHSNHEHRGTRRVREATTCMVWSNKAAQPFSHETHDLVRQKSKSTSS